MGLGERLGGGGGYMILHFDLPDVERVIFYKLDRITIDLICCDVEADGKTWTFHEELEVWAALMSRLEALPGFRADWFAAVSKPAFALCETVAYKRV